MAAAEHHATEVHSESATTLVASVIFGLLALATLLGVAELLGMAPFSQFSASIVVTCVSLAVAAVALHAKTPRELVHGGQAFSAVAAGLANTGILTFFAAGVLPGLVYQHGFDAYIAALGIAGGLALMLVAIGPALRRTGAATFAELTGFKFGPVARAAVALISMLVAAGLLIALLRSGISTGARLLDTPPVAVAAGTALIVALIAVPGGLRATFWTAIVPYILVLGIFIVVLALAGYRSAGMAVPHLATGALLAEIGPGEERLIEAGLVDFGLFKSFTKEFLAVDALNWGLITLSIAAAISVLPPLVAGTQITRNATASRRGTAWTLVFTVLLLTLVPTAAAVVRLELYRAIPANGEAAPLPAWIQTASTIDAVRIDGVSLALVSKAVEEVARGASTHGAIAERLSADAIAPAWQKLDLAVQEAITGLARDSAEKTPAEQWQLLQERVLPAAASAAGKDANRLDLAAVTVDPRLLPAVLPALAGLPLSVMAVLMAVVLASAVSCAAALVGTIGTSAGHDLAGALHPAAQDRASMWPLRLAAAAVSGLAAWAAFALPLDLEVLLVGSLSLAACGLFPVALLVIWWPRATVWGVFAALAAGLTAGAYYLLGTTLYSVTFYDAWYGLSNAGPDAHAEFEELKALWVAADGEARAIAYQDMVSRAGGALWSPGLANWFGIAPAANAVIAIPLALLAGVLVSFVTPAADRAGAQDLHRRMHSWAAATRSLTSETADA